MRKILLGVSSSKMTSCVDGPGSDKGRPSASSLITCHAGVLPVDQHFAMPDSFVRYARYWVHYFTVERTYLLFDSRKFHHICKVGEV